MKLCLFVLFTLLWFGCYILLMFFVGPIGDLINGNAQRLGLTGLAIFLSAVCFLMMAAAWFLTLQIYKDSKEG